MPQPQGGPVLCTIEVFGNEPAYNVRCGGKQTTCTTPLDVIFLIHWIVEQFIESFIWEDYVVFHGGLIAKGGCAYGLAAPTRTGKSTLTAYLCAEAYAFYADDCIYANRESGTVLPFALPIVLRNLLPQLHNEVLAEGFNSRRAEYSYFVKTARHQGSAPKLTHMLFLHRGSRNAIVPMTQGESYAALLHNLKTPRELGREVVFLKEFSKKISCFSLHFQDLIYAKQAIDRLPTVE
jgi:hypothetical protein